MSGVSKRFYHYAHRTTSLREFFIRDQDARAGIADDVADFVGGEPKVDRQKHRADMAGRKYQFEKGGAVLHQHRDDVARAYSA